MGDRKRILEKNIASRRLQDTVHDSDTETLERTVTTSATEYIERIDERLHEYRQLLKKRERYVPFPKETRKEYYRTYLDTKAFLDSLSDDAKTDRTIEWLQIKFQHLENYIVRNNQGIVYTFVNKSHHKIANSHLDSDDLVQLAYDGMFSALLRYDPDVSEFTTYAVHWIQQRIDFGTNRATGVTSIPRDKLLRYFAYQNGLEITEQELSQKEIDKITMLLTPKGLESQRKEDNEEISFLDFYVSEDYERNKERETKQQEWEEFEKLYLSHLSEREQEVLLKRPTESLEAIGNQFDLTRERIRQIEAQAKERIRFLVDLREIFEKNYAKPDEYWERLVAYTTSLKKNTADTFISYLKTQDPRVLKYTTRNTYTSIREFVSQFDQGLYKNMITAKRNRDISFSH